MKFAKTFALLATIVASAVAHVSPAWGVSTDFNTWTQVQDPAHPNFTASVDTAAQISLFAGNGAVPIGTDIGYKSINGSTPATSTAGFAFDPAASFQVAIDFAFSLQNPVGGLGIGFGIGEDEDGENSAGVAVFTQNGIAIPVFAAGRVNDISQGLPILPPTTQLSGSFFAAYDATTGDVTVGVASAAGANAPTSTATFLGIQNSWGGGNLLASFFLRSDSPIQAWTSGNATAVFSDFRVLAGTPTAAPEPGSLSLLALGGLTLTSLRRRWRRKAGSE